MSELADALLGLFASLWFVWVWFFCWISWRGIVAFLEYRDHKAYVQSPEYRAKQLEREEKARRRAVEAHRLANLAEHELWLQHFESSGETMWFCPDCGFPYRRHVQTCRAFGAQADVTIR